MSVETAAKTETIPINRSVILFMKGIRKGSLSVNVLGEKDGELICRYTYDLEVRGEQAKCFTVPRVDIEKCVIFTQRD